MFRTRMRDPTRFATQTTAQFLPRLLQVVVPSSAPTIIYRLLPVKSSAPAMTTSMRPTLNVAPKTSCPMPLPRYLGMSWLTVRAK